MRHPDIKPVVSILLQVFGQVIIGVSDNRAAAAVDMEPSGLTDEAEFVLGSLGAITVVGLITPPPLFLSSITFSLSNIHHFCFSLVVSRGNPFASRASRVALYNASF